MRIFWFPFIVVLLLNIAVDYYIYRKLRTMRRGGTELSRLHIVLAAVAHVTMVVALLQPVLSDEFSSWDMNGMMKVIWFYFMFYVPKLLWALLYQLSLPRPLPRWLRFTAKAVALVVSLVALFAMWMGYTRTPYDCKVTEVEISPQGLSQTFDGYRIVHISDLHLGTYDNDTTFVAQCVDSINALNPDVIVFTGDLVSRETEEAYAFTYQLSRLTARDGVLSILGNHDYDDYTTMTLQEKAEDHQLLEELITDAGWKLLEDDVTHLYRGSDSITVVGTHNYSRGNKHNYCNFDSVFATVPDSTFTLLLQHNPQMWRDKILGKKNIGLMLSGHTHAFQIIIPFFGHRISPARLLFREWGGLYAENGQHLYVNTGLGMVGIPARVGATPEITLITLKAHGK